MRIVFPYFAQLHQVLHSLPIAAELARRYPAFSVHVAVTTLHQRRFVARMLRQHAPEAPVHIDELQPLRIERLQFAHKWRRMWGNRDYFSSFDAIVTPERTSLFMRRLRLGRARMIWTRHGAGDRAVGFADSVKGFDYVLMAGRKIEQRLLRQGLIRPGCYSTGVYAKFDWLGAHGGTRLFDNDRPTILYNPHFRPRLGSWPVCGFEVLDYFAASARYNLIFAPHVRLFDPPTAEKYRAFARYRSLPHLHIDLGSERSVDMSYLNVADLYLGDVSSQVAEFLCRPRPCLFLNAHRVDWRRSADYRFWELGPVIESVRDLGPALDAAFARHEDFRAAQLAYIDDSFGVVPGSSSAAKGADAIAGFLCTADA